MSLRFTILGSGNSTGVPTAGNYWGKCDPAEPKNTRTRCSMMVQSAETTLVIDTGPDFRQQINRENVQAIDAVLYTHMHSDHTIGIEDLRPLRYRMERLVPIYADAVTMRDLQTRFGYLFPEADNRTYRTVEPHVLQLADFGRSMRIGDIELTPFLQDHGTCESVGYRFGEVAYSVDILTLDEAAIEVLRGVRVWIVDCAGYGQTNNPVHANLETIVALNKKIGAGEVYLTSLTVGADYQTLLRELPSGYKPAFDRMVIS